MIKIDRNVNMLFLKRAAIVDALEEAKYGETGIEFPLKGFHTLYETRFGTADGYAVTWAWITGGRGDGLRYTVAVADNGYGDVKVGWERGHKDYVFIQPIYFPNYPDNPNKFINAIKRLTPRKLTVISEIPGFDADGRHKDGWFTKGLFALEMAQAPCLGEGAKAWAIKEGIYIAFPDGSCRLMSQDEYRNILGWDTPAFRQGDLLLFKLDPAPIEFYGWGEPKHPNGFKIVPQDGEYNIDRHCIEGQVFVYESVMHSNPVCDFSLYSGKVVVAGPARVIHPEHGILELPEGQYHARLLLGTSRPFQDGID